MICPNRRGASQPFIIVEAAKILTEEQRAAPLPHTPPLGHRPSHASTAYIFLLNLYILFPAGSRGCRLDPQGRRRPEYRIIGVLRVLDSNDGQYSR